MPHALRKPGFHVIAIDKYEEISNAESVERKRSSFIDFLRLLEKGEVPRYLRVDGLDEFLTRTGEEGLQSLRALLGEKLGILVANMSSIVFVVKARIDDIVTQPTIRKIPLSMIFPRPHDPDSVQPGYVYYPIM
jgi:hypothetical protein